MTRYSYFDDYTEEEREQVVERMKKEHQSWKEIIKRFGHPSEWKEEQMVMML